MRHQYVFSLCKYGVWDSTAHRGFIWFHLVYGSVYLFISDVNKVPLGGRITEVSRGRGEVRISGREKGFV